MIAPSPGSMPVTVDVAIIGGGIAGSSLAITLRRAGLDVALIEREPIFRDRIRGEAIHPWGVREVHALGLRDLLDEAGALPLPFWTRYRDAIPTTPYAWLDDFPDSPGSISVNHVRLQNLLITSARDSGARVFHPAIAIPVAIADGWDIAINSEAGATAIHALLVVGADGQRSATRSLIGGTDTRDPIHHQMGGMLVHGVDLPRNSAHQGFQKSGFGMIYLQSDNLARVYYVCQTEEARTLQGSVSKALFLQRVGALFPDGAFARTAPAGPLGFFPNSDIVSDRVSGHQAVLIGDAAGANDPSQGHGLALVYRDIRILRDLLLANAIADIPPLFAHARRSYFNVLRQHARWAAPLGTDTGDEIDALREQIQRAREIDPTAGGFAGIFATGPDGLSVDDASRAHFYGEDLLDASVFGYPAASIKTLVN